ncbi:rRNA maturation RNase YbeY [Aliidiomarina sp.]|uniref:rRNA maturation RNase YbeY n=1 Tax=Aliidiomarina sp. TaxID=1872439 RepID=UPI003A4DF659
MDFHVDIQNTLAEQGVANEIPTAAQITAWASAALTACGLTTAELTIRITDANEVQTLNRDYRGNDKPTNVLSFPFADELPEGVELDIPLLGDIVICNEVMQSEAQAANISLEHHFAHLVIHGTLHLLGYDHIDDAEAEEMEALEIKLLAEFSIPSPYANNHAFNEPEGSITNHSRSE